MNVDKAALKMALAQAWASKIEGLEDNAKRDLYRLEGSSAALRQAATALEAHRAYYQTQVDDGDLDGPQCKLAMQVITRCVGGLQNLVDKAQLATTLKQGELQGIRRGIDLLEAEFKAEKARLEAIADMVEHDGRPDGAAQEIQRRKEEARVERAAAPAEPEAPMPGQTKKKADGGMKKKKDGGMKKKKTDGGFGTKKKDACGPSGKKKA